MNFDTATKPRFIGILGLVWSTLREWADRASQRQALAELEAEQLADLNISFDARHRECGKPFWRK